METPRPQIVQLIPFRESISRGEPTGFFGLDAMGGIWRTELHGGGDQSSVRWMPVLEE
jgi:hypothetical protein